MKKFFFAIAMMVTILISVPTKAQTKDFDAQLGQAEPVFVGLLPSPTMNIPKGYTKIDIMKNHGIEIEPGSMIIIFYAKSQQFDPQDKSADNIVDTNGWIKLKTGSVVRYSPEDGLTVAVDLGEGSGRPLESFALLNYEPRYNEYRIDLELHDNENKQPSLTSYLFTEIWIK